MIISISEGRHNFTLVNRGVCSLTGRLAWRRAWPGERCSIALGVRGLECAYDRPQPVKSSSDRDEGCRRGK